MTLELPEKGLASLCDAVARRRNPKGAERDGPDGTARPWRQDYLGDQRDVTRLRERQIPPGTRSGSEAEMLSGGI